MIHNVFYNKVISDDHRELDFVVFNKPFFPSVLCSSSCKPLFEITPLHIGQVDTYGTQQPIALLKLLLERHGCYDRGKDLNWKHMKDLSYIAAMGMCTTQLYQGDD